MREVKFRFWDRELKKYNFLNLHDLGEGDVYWYDGETTVWEVLYDSTHEQERFIVGQYTGLKDENGVEIYDGDFVKCKNYHGDVEGVISKSGSYYYLACSSGYSDEYLFNCSDIEVIGNVYSNKELLEESEE